MTKLSLPAVLVCGWVFGICFIAVWGVVFALVAMSEDKFLIGVILVVAVAVSCCLALLRD